MRSPPIDPLAHSPTSRTRACRVARRRCLDDPVVDSCRFSSRVGGVFVERLVCGGDSASTANGAPSSWLAR